MMDFGYLDALLGEEAEEAVTDIGEGYRHVWVVAEKSDHVLTPPTLEAMGQGRDIADQIGVYLIAVLLGHGLRDDLAQSLAAYGADKVLFVDDPLLAHYQVERYTTALENLVHERRPEIVLFPATALGNDLAPRLAQRLETGLMSHCVRLGLDMAERQLLGTVARLNGDCFHTLSCPQARPQFATLAPGAFQSPYLEAGRSCAVERLPVALDGANGRLTWVEMGTAVTKPSRSLVDARIVVAAGRGLQDAEGFALVEQLAAALGGEVAGSRGALDEGWIDAGRQVGITGLTINPNLYIACGISGAIQHLVGIQDAYFVIAINRDADAPIMQIANVGVVGDVKEVLTALVEKVGKMSKALVE